MNKFLVQDPNDYLSLNSWGKPSINQYKPDDPWGSMVPSLNNNPYSVDSMGIPMNEVMQQVPTDSSWLTRTSFFGGKDPSTGMMNVGWGPTLFNMGKGIFDGWMGLQALDLAKDNLNFQKDSFSKQFENQRTLTNARLRDRQMARVAGNPNAYQSVDEYMRQNGV